MLEPDTQQFTYKAGPEEVRVRRTSYPLLPADCSIVYAAQGESYPCTLLDLAPPPKVDCKKHWLSIYVMLSRARNLESILLLRNAPRAAFTCGPPDYLKAEFHRLQNLEAATTARAHKILAAAPALVSNLATFFATAPQQDTAAPNRRRPSPQLVVSPVGQTAAPASPRPPPKRCRGKQTDPHAQLVATPRYDLPGLRNNDNTCYLNALLVSLHASSHVHAWVREHMTACGLPNCPVPFLSQDFECLSSPTQPPYVPHLASFRTTWCPAFAGRRHQDVTEALSKLLEAAESCELRSRNVVADDLDHQLTLPVWRCFGSTKFQSLLCTACGAFSSSRHLHSFIHVEAALPLFHDCARCHLLTDDSCPQCTAPNCRRMTLAMRAWPKTLVFCINRWSNNAVPISHPFSDQITTPEPRTLYRFKAAVYHEGTQQHGHYTAVTPSASALLLRNDSLLPQAVPVTYLQHPNLYMIVYDAPN